MIKFKQFLLENRKTYTSGQLDQWSNSPLAKDRKKAAERGTNKHRDQLVNDKNEWVKAYVARYGTDEHRDKLVNDPIPDVHRTVAMCGNFNHKKALWDDLHSLVKHYART
jgi:hypothetical protein